MRIITGLPIFFDISAGIAMTGYAFAFEPKPPPQYSAISTRSSGLMPMRPASVGTMNVWLCEEPCTKHLPFCQ